MLIVVWAYGHPYKVVSGCDRINVNIVMTDFWCTENIKVLIVIYTGGKWRGYKIR